MFVIGHNNMWESYLQINESGNYSWTASLNEAEIFDSPNDALTAAMHFGRHIGRDVNPSYNLELSRVESGFRIVETL